MDSFAPEFSRYWLPPGSGDERVQPIARATTPRGNSSRRSRSSPSA